MKWDNRSPAAGRSRVRGYSNTLHSLRLSDIWLSDIRSKSDASRCVPGSAGRRVVCSLNTAAGQCVQRRKMQGGCHVIGQADHSVYLSA